ncbi:hypothetical protein HT031_000745 [Scenedesmus sp. PABB004]|nr:hypothetical protein HT031_000745 [Scenedesmus sp. PABB004]
MAAADAVQRLLSAVGAPGALDADVRDYVLAVLEEPDDEACLEVLTEVIASSVPAFARLSREQQTAAVLRLLEDARACAAAAAAGGGGGGAGVDAVVAAFKSVACSDITNRVNAPRAAAGAGGGGDDGSSCSSGGACGACGEAPDPEQLAALLALCPPGADAAFAGALLARLGGLEAAAEWVLAQDDVLGAQDDWRAAAEEREERRRREAQERQQSKRAIVERFDLQPVPGGARRPKFGDDPLPRKKGADDAAGKVRYRDGRVVSTRGEKVIIEKVGEEWDGGSKGKVYTKGKRGKGFV